MPCTYVYTEMSMRNGTRLARACGTQFVCHKVTALEWVIDRVGAYISHLVTIANDPKAKSSDWQKMKGYSYIKMAGQYE